MTGLQTVVQLFGNDVCGRYWLFETRLGAVAPRQGGLVWLLGRAGLVGLLLVSMCLIPMATHGGGMPIILKSSSVD